MKELQDLLATMQKTFDELLAVENKKLDAIAANNMEVLNECIKQEEALSLNLRGIDKRREDLQSEMGFAGLTLRQTAEKIGGADGEKLIEAQAILAEKATELKAAIEASRKVVESNMESVNSVLAGRAAEEIGYQPTGEKKKPDEKPRFTPKEV